MRKLLVLMMLTLAACTSSEQAEEQARQARRERQEMEESRQLKEQHEREAAALREQEAAKPEEPAAPPEPEYRDVTTYYFTSNTEKTAVSCSDEGAMHECGITFEDCNGSAYYCQTGVKVFSKTKKELVTE